MTVKSIWLSIIAPFLILLFIMFETPPGFAQDQSAAAEAAAPVDDQSPPPLTEEELEVLVARIALYPDELIAAISGASLYPLQIVEASRFLDDYAKDNSLEPKSTWDGSIISLLNYPEIVKMMSDDLDWTQSLGDALTYQQKDVLVAIQQLREQAVADGIIKSDDKMDVSEENDNIIIKPADPEVVYVPQYEPQMLYDPGYAPAPISYYPDPYPNYYWPTATFFTAAVTGAVWAAAVDWDDWGVWGGRWNGGGVDIDCNRCFNNVNVDGKFKFNDIDWKNVDRSKINFDKDKLKNIDRSQIRNNIKQNTNNSIRNRASEIKKKRPTTLPGKAGNTRDIRKSTLDGLKGKPGASNNLANARPANRPSRPAADRKRPQKANVQRPANKKASRPSGKKKPAAKRDNRPKNASKLGKPSRGKQQKVAAKRGNKSMGGGRRGGGQKAHKSVKRKGGGGRRRR
nr:DUF3300 domain-containing protein [Stappia sediminis]